MGGPKGSDGNSNFLNPSFYPYVPGSPIISLYSPPYNCTTPTVEHVPMKLTRRDSAELHVNRRHEADLHRDEEKQMSNVETIPRRNCDL